MENLKMCGEMLCGAKGELGDNFGGVVKNWGERWRMVGIGGMVVMGGMGRIVEHVGSCGGGDNGWNVENCGDCGEWGE